MNKTQTAKTAMYSRVIAFLESNKSDSIIGSYTRLKKELGIFSSKAQEISNLNVQQSQSTTGVTSTKEAAFNLMSKLIVNAAKKARAWAIDNSNETLIDTFSIVSSQFDKKAQGKGLATLKLVQKALEDHIAGINEKEYKLTAAQVADSGKSITDYEAISPTPGNVKSNKQAATKIINTTIEAADNSLYLIDDLIESEFSDSHPDFVTEYYTNRRIDDVSGRHTGAFFTVKDAFGKQLENVEITVDNSTKTAETDLHGEADIIGLKAATYNISFTLKGFVTQTKPVTVDKRRMVDVELVLVADSGAKGTVTQNGQAAAGLPVTVVGNNISAITDANGHYMLNDLPAGTYTLQTSNASGDSDHKTITIALGQVVVVDLQL